MKTREVLLTVIIFIICIALIYGIISTYFMIKIVINANPLNYNNYLILIANVGAKQNNVDISISRTSPGICKDLYNLTFSGCNLIQNSEIQYFLKCSEFPSKSIIAVNCSVDGKFIVVYESDLVMTQYNFDCIANKCTLFLNTTTVKWGNLIIKQVPQILSP